MLLTYHFVLGLKSIIKSIIKLAFFFFFHNPIVTWGPCHHFTDVKSCGENRVFDFPEYLTQGHVRENLLRNCKHEMWMCWCSCPPVTSETIILTSLKNSHFCSSKVLRENWISSFIISDDFTLFPYMNWTCAIILH